MDVLKGKPLPESINVFRSGVERVLTNWTALKLAVEHGTGGPNSKDIASNFVQYIGDIFCDGGNFEAEDISDILVDVMDSQFETWCEDNSPYEIASFLCKLYDLCKLGRMEEMKLEIDKLPPCHASLSREMPVSCSQTPMTLVPLAPVVENMDAIGDSEKETEVLPEEEPGWTRVTSRRRHVS